MAYELVTALIKIIGESANCCLRSSLLNALATGRNNPMNVSANADASKTGDCGPSFLTEYVRYSTNYKQIKQYKKWKSKYWEQAVAASVQH